MRELGLGESELWDTPEASIGLLSAPTEVHFAITNKCSNGCVHCYMGAGNQDQDELDTESLKRVLDTLAKMKVFHIALGGGEALERPDLFEIAGYARAIGLVPNLTISGMHITPEIAKEMKVFGQVNVSVDGVGPRYSVFRGKDMFAVADKALALLVSVGIPVGINCVIGKSNFDGIQELFQYAKKMGVNEIEFLRLKPSGRGSSLYDKERTTYEQNISLIPMLARFSAQYGCIAKIDCSFIPMLCYHHPPRKILELMATYGCEAGNVLLGIRSNGVVSGCSFLESSGLSVFDFSSLVCHRQYFEKIGSWPQRAPQPCRGCEYLVICRGGCHAVSIYATGDFDSPDPDCPFMVEYKNRKITNECESKK
jgi:radical SAM protein with 4Fe4S-binding SPASM domain